MIGVRTLAGRNLKRTAPAKHIPALVEFSSHPPIPPNFVEKFPFFNQLQEDGLRKIVSGLGLACKIVL